MGIESQVQQEVSRALAELVADGTLPADVLACSYKVEPPKRREHGDVATNVALAVQKAAGKPPREVAGWIAERLGNAPIVAGVDVAGPGFINLRLVPAAFLRILEQVHREGRGYGRARAAVRGRVMVEFVSANPTGPLLISHGRNAILGDAVSALLEAAGWHVSREYYINDFGNQVRLLAESVRAAHAGEPAPEGGYGAPYVAELARWAAAQAPEVLSGEDAAALGRLCVTRVLDGISGSADLPGIRQTLAMLGVRFDVWFSEESLHRWGRVRNALAELERRGALVERDGALFFRSEQEGDDQDRVVQKSDGHFTYFASDIAYHADKYARGYDRLIVVLGADHHGYEPRVRGAIGALGLDRDRFEVLLFQLVHLLRDGKPYKMGKRLGNLITINEVTEEIDQAMQRAGAGADALRYFYLSRRADSPIDIDIELAKKSSVDNPVFYLQMGYARLCSIQRRAREVFDLEVPPHGAELAARVTHPDELQILAQLGRFPDVVAEAAEAREPHRIIFYLTDLSQSFQSYFTRLKAEGDAILPLGAQMKEPDWRARWDRERSLARLLWIEAIRIVYGAALGLLGISAPERLEPLDDAATPPTDHETREETT
ncbi:MAG: arginine--tRNA ligase [Deltaproteobacteria bacterium]|jgi:arginyl-tRNA synthetase|nr:arginine--tRNA ligase [Deltaproteobacteria bacterium]MBW2535923.1 arginine--tRNA ligase [Deltaproteobacteria bacterium]